MFKSESKSRLAAMFGWQDPFILCSVPNCHGMATKNLELIVTPSHYHLSTTLILALRHHWHLVAIRVIMAAAHEGPQPKYFFGITTWFLNAEASFKGWSTHD